MARRTATTILRAAALALFLACTPAHAQQAPAADKLFLVVFSIGPAWDKAKPPPEQPAFREHAANLKRLRQAERIAMGARYADKGMIVLRAASEREAREEIERDPGVRGGTFTFEVHEMRVFYPGMVGGK